MDYDTGYNYEIVHDKKNNMLVVKVTKTETIDKLVSSLAQNSPGKENNKENSNIVDITGITSKQPAKYAFVINYENKKDLYRLVSNDPIVVKGNKYTMNDPNGHLLGFINLYADKPVIVINEDIIRDMESFMKVFYHELMHTFFKDEIIDRVVTDTMHPEKIINNSKYAA